MMHQLFADPSRPLMDQAVPRHLDPLPINEVADYITGHFQHSRRDPGAALDPLLEFTRGHPQRSMMLAHYLWQRTPARSMSDETTWLSALDQVSADTNQLMQAIWRALPTNERRMARALAVSAFPLHSEETASLVGIKRSSIGRALEGLEGKADVITLGGRARLTDPLFEYWLRTRGVLPDDPEDV